MYYYAYLVHVGAPFCGFSMLDHLYMAQRVKKVIGIHHWMPWNKEQSAVKGQGDSR